MQGSRDPTAVQYFDLADSLHTATILLRQAMVHLGGFLCRKYLLPRASLKSASKTVWSAHKDSACSIHMWRNGPASSPGCPTSLSRACRPGLKKNLARACSPSASPFPPQQLRPPTQIIDCSLVTFVTTALTLLAIPMCVSRGKNHLIHPLLKTIITRALKCALP